MTGCVEDRLLWLDVETVGLGPSEQSKILEIGWIVTGWGVDPDWTRLQSYVIRHDPGEISRDQLFPPHRRNGLAEAITDPAASVPLHVAMTALRMDVYELVRDGHRVLLAGNTPGFDAGVITTADPTVLEGCHHHMIDMSSVGELITAWAPSAIASKPDTTTNHRVGTCLRKSLALAAWTRMVLAAPLRDVILTGIRPAYPGSERWLGAMNPVMDPSPPIRNIVNAQASSVSSSPASRRVMG